MKIVEKLISILLILVLTASCSSRNNKQDKEILEDKIDSPTPTYESLLTPTNLPTGQKTPAPTNINTTDPSKKLLDQDGDGFVDLAIEIDGEKKFYKVPVDEDLNDIEGLVCKIKNGEISESDERMAHMLEIIENKHNVRSKDPMELFYDQIKNKIANGESLNEVEKNAYFSYLCDQRKDIVPSLSLGIKELESYDLYEWIKAHVLSYYCNKSYYEIVKMRDSNKTWAEIAESLGINYDIIPSEYKRSPYKE